MTWSEKVIKLMSERGINQKQLSVLSGINESSISRYLHLGQRPRMDVVVNIAKALQVDTDYLLDEGESTESAYITISTAIARKGNELSAEEKNRLISLLIGRDENV
ncbi:MAG: helix-turn-helix domain-containing protein [Eubacterium sp.]|nr:helix-turn-helix domain-containing protein [Eubacterium sp.]